MATRWIRTADHRNVGDAGTDWIRVDANAFAAMKIVKVRRVGNSNVISIPRELEARGYVLGSSVPVEELPGGELRVVSTEMVRERIGDLGKRVVDEHGEALRILADHDPDLGTSTSWGMEEDQSNAFELIYLELEDVLELHGLIVDVDIARD